MCSFSVRTAQFGVFQTEIGQQLRIEEARNKEASHAFFKYAQRWWKEYTEIHPHFKHRRVKIFAEDETGKPRMSCTYAIQRLATPACVSRAAPKPPACPFPSTRRRYVTPMRAGRLLDTPRHAARFVSLMPSRHAPGVGSGERVEAWRSMNTFIALREGTVARWSLSAGARRH